MAFTPYLQQQLLKTVFGGAQFTPPTEYVLGLSFTDPIAVGITEPTGGAYSRVTIPNTSANWNAPVVDPANGGYKITNAASISFPTATDNWVNGNNNSVGFYFLQDTATPPNLIASGALTTPKLIYSGDTPSFAPGQLSITLD
ncbi:hypothetical protein QB910_000038 [Dabrowskivirus KKP3916]|uniref:Uncharacterized protein n=1 Tax=Alicyclobacillus phage KKP_3916 TaxID=3040651 RepID=A0AAT9V8Q0_9CAUD|nr:hypothetical protein QB910_000038 [Alicyclobacillus phage KKP 3916]